MPPKCPVGTIRRKAYTRKDGTHVRSTCVLDRGLPGKTAAKRKSLPTPTPGSLSKYGYFNLKSKLADVRRKALLRGVKDAGYATIVRRVNLIANYNKNSDPRLYKILRADIKWMQHNLKDKYSAAALRAS